jgi:hypothetical protein
VAGGLSRPAIQHLQHPPGDHHVVQILLSGHESDPHVIASPDSVAVDTVLTLTQEPALLANPLVHRLPAIRRRRQERQPLGGDHHALSNLRRASRRSSSPRKWSRCRRSSSRSPSATANRRK